LTEEKISKKKPLQKFSNTLPSAVTDCGIA